MPTLSEAESKRVLAAHGVAFPAEREVRDAPTTRWRPPETLGHPVVLKLGGAGIAHKTERGLVRLGLADDDAVAEAAPTSCSAAARPEDGEVHLLVAPMLRGNRELIAGLHHDEQFGMTVMLGVGGVLAEALADVAFRLVPITRLDAARDDRRPGHPGAARRGARRAGRRPRGAGRRARRPVGRGRRPTRRS